MSLIWAMMILPLADALQNCLQNLTSRIAGIDNEQMSGRVMGVGTMLGFGLGAIKEQFKSPSSNNTNNNSEGGFKGFFSRAKSIINPGMNLSDEKDYNGNINPIRDVLPKEKTNSNASTTKLNNTNKQNNFNNNVNVGDVARGALNVTKAYLGMGAKLVEGDFSKSSYSKGNYYARKRNYQSTEYISKVENNNEIEKLGDENEPKK